MKKYNFYIINSYLQTSLMFCVNLFVRLKYGTTVEE